jgi:hypothetical protein
MEASGRSAEWSVLALLPPLELLRHVHEQQLATSLAAPFADPYVVAQNLASLGRGEEALHWLDVAMQQRSASLPLMAADPELAPLRRSAHFRELTASVLAKMRPS